MCCWKHHEKKYICNHLKETFVSLHIKPYDKDIYESYMMFYSIIMTTGTVTRAGVHCWHHLLKDETFDECSVESSHVPTLKLKVKQQLLAWKQLFQRLQKTNSHFWLMNRCLISSFGVGTWEDTTKHLAIVPSFKTTFSDELSKHVKCPFTCVVFS